MLLFAGDGRFATLGISTSAAVHPPPPGPYPLLSDLIALSAAVDDVQSQAPVSADMLRLIQPGVTLGGARPKALLHTDSGPCVVKFAELDDAVDTPLARNTPP